MARNWKIWTVVSFVGVLSAAVAGCNESGSATPAPEATQESTQGATAQADTARGATDATDMKDGKGRGHRGGGFRHHGPPGPDFLLVAALHDLDLTDAQKTTIQGALDGLHADRKERPAPDKAPLAALAQGVRAGKIDAAAVGMKRPEPPADHLARVQAAVQTLHDTLTAEQRTALVAKIEQKASEFGQKPFEGGKHGRPDGKGFGGHDKMGPMGFMLRDLELTDAQKESIGKALEAQREAHRPAAQDEAARKQQFEAMRTEMKTRLTSFAADRFDAAAFVAPPAAMKEHGDMGQRMASELAVVVPLLTSVQRDKLAVKLEQGPAMERAGAEPCEHAKQ